MEVKNIIEKIKQNDVQYLREFFRKYPHKINQTNTTGGTYLMAACVEGHIDFISFLIETGAELDLRDKHGCTALYHAVNYGRHDAVALLISKKATVNIANEYGQTPLDRAVYNDDKHALELLLNNKENTSLQVNQEYHDGWTPLHLACAMGQTDIVKLLLPLPGIKINVVDKLSGRTPLHFAVRWGRYDVVTLMLSQDSVELDVKDKMERTPLLLAISMGNLGIIHGLIAHGADINAVDGDGNNCLHIAVNSEVECWHSEVEPIAILNEYCTKLKLSMTLRLTQPVVFCYLVHHGADLYCKNKKNVTALDLIQNVDLREKIKSLFPPLHCMFCGKNKPMVKFHLCGHSLSCEKCYFKNPRRKCPCCQQLVRNKSGFESPKSYELFLQDVAQQVKWQRIESPESYKQFVQDLAQQLGGKLQQIETPKIEKNVPTVSQPTPSTSSISQPVETPKIEKNVPKVSKPTPGTSSVSQPIESPKFGEKLLQDVAQQLGDTWKQVGRNLGIKNVKLEIIKCDNPNNTVEQSFQMLYKWFTSCDSKTNMIEQLREALNANDCFDALACLPSEVN